MVASAIGNVIGAFVSADASRHAANVQADSARNATEAQLNMFNQVRQSLQPYIDFGSAGLPQLNALLGGPDGDTEAIKETLGNLPGYQFTRDQGLQSVQNSYAARGLGSSGAALRGAADYATGLAQSNYNQYLSNLLARAGLGENAAAGFGNNAVASGQGIASSLQAAGSAQAAGILGSANAFNNAIGSVGQNYLANKILSNYLNSSPSSSGGGYYSSSSGTDPFAGTGLATSADYTGLLSDRRLKSNIKQVGTLTNGLKVYSYRLLGEVNDQIGLMADEVEAVHPEAVSIGTDGFKRVNYAKAVT